MARRRRILERRLVLLNLKSGGAIRGILWADEAGLYVVKSAEWIDAGGEPVRLDGEAIIDAENVAFVQTLPPPTPTAPAHHPPVLA